MEQGKTAVCGMRRAGRGRVHWGRSVGIGCRRHHHECAFGGRSMGAERRGHNMIAAQFELAASGLVWQRVAATGADGACDGKCKELETGGSEAGGVVIRPVTPELTTALNLPREDVVLIHDVRAKRHRRQA